MRNIQRREVAPVFSFEMHAKEKPSHLAYPPRDFGKLLRVTSHTEAGWVSIDVREFWTSDSGRTMERVAMVTLDKESACRLVDHLSAALAKHL